MVLKFFPTSCPAVVGCDPGSESVFVVDHLGLCSPEKDWIVGCDPSESVFVVDHPGLCSPEKDWIVGCDPSESVFVVDHPGWCSPETDCCWL